MKPKCTYCEAVALVTYCKACGTFAPDSDTPDGNLMLAAPDLLKALTEGIGIHPTDDFATDLETIAHFIKMYYPLAALDLRRKAKAIRAALASAKGEKVE